MGMYALGPPGFSDSDGFVLGASTWYLSMHIYTFSYVYICMYSCVHADHIMSVCRYMHICTYKDHYIAVCIHMYVCIHI